MIQENTMSNSSTFTSFRVPPPSQTPAQAIKPPVKDECCARIEDIVLPIFASLVGFVFLPVQLAVAITFVVTVGSILYYNDCLDCPDKGPAGPKKDVQTEMAKELFKRTFPVRDHDEDSEVSVGSNDPGEGEVLDLYVPGSSGKCWCNPAVGDLLSSQISQNCWQELRGRIWMGLSFECSDQR